MRIRSLKGFPTAVAALIVLGTLPLLAQDNRTEGKLAVHVSPKQAYVFVDGKAIRDGSQTLKLSAGKHTIGVYNYGYAPQTRDVELTSGTNQAISVILQPTGDKVSGPFGDIEFKGYPRAAVLVNGTTPSYFVGHVDEFDWNWIWHQQLLVHPGTYQITVTREGNTIWSGPVTVKAGQRATVDLHKNGMTTTKDWKEGNTLGPQPRFHAGIASATVPIAPVSANLTAQQTQINCGQSSNLNWTSADAADVSITNLGEVPANGNRSVNPAKTTAYELVARGPGGEVTQTAKVSVNTEPSATLTLSQPEIRNHKIGTKVVEQGSANLNWSASNASSVTIQPLGSESTSGSQTIEAKPNQTTEGPINQELNYTLKATNACGGSATRTASLRIEGSIDPAPAVTLASVFYPTAFPTKRHPKVGLVASADQKLEGAAHDFLNRENYDAPMQLRIIGHADVRGSKKYNQALSERRAEMVKNYLISQGVSADRIQTRAVGKDDQLDQKKVEVLQSEDQQKPAHWMTRKEKATWLAYNRRVDVVLEPEGQQSTVAYPNDSANARVLWQRPMPSLKAVEAAGQTTTATREQAQASHAGN